MKNLKSYLFLLFVGFCAVSCSSDDNPEADFNFEEKIVGTWQLIGREPNGIEFCELSNTIKFSTDSAFFIELFIGDDPDENCQSASGTGTWDYLGDDKIEIDLTEVEENEVLTIEFFNNFKGIKVRKPDNSNFMETYMKQ